MSISRREFLRAAGAATVVVAAATTGVAALATPKSTTKAIGKLEGRTIVIRDCVFSSSPHEIYAEATAAIDRCDYDRVLIERCIFGV